jgi:eukaryotic-like serine/threonine-protein kinase
MRDDAVQKVGEPADAGAPRPPDTLVAGRYRLGEPLGQGAVANVYRAVDVRLDRQVAVKVFHPGQENVVRARFGAEARALARLSHPGLVGIFDAGVDDDRPYLVMQLVGGESLRERLLGGPRSAGEVLALGARLAAALAHVHANDVVHRDVKPSNIVLDADGAPHLADFGIALLLDVVRLTGANEIMGTAAYLAPEQILGEGVDAAADVYSLGLVLLECLTGELEYPGVSRVESALARLHRPPRIPEGIPTGLADLLRAMTSRAAGDRPSASDCAARLVAVAQHVSTARARRTAVRRAVRRRLMALPRPGTYRTSAPLLSGWRRFVIAGSGLAMAIVASTWLFTSLMPRMAPQPTAENPLQQSVPGPLVNVPQVVEVPRGDSAMHIAVGMSAGGSAGPATSTGSSSTPASTLATTDLSGSSPVTLATTGIPQDTTPLYSTQDSPVPTGDSGPSNGHGPEISPTDGSSTDGSPSSDAPSGTPTQDTSPDDTGDQSSIDTSTEPPPTTTTKPTRTLR